MNVLNASLQIIRKSNAVHIQNKPHNSVKAKFCLIKNSKTCLSTFYKQVLKATKFKQEYVIPVSTIFIQPIQKRLETKSMSLN